MPPLKFSSEAWSARPNDEEFEELMRRAENGEVDAWKTWGENTQDELYLFAHPKDMDKELLLAYASMSGVIKHIRRKTVLVVESEATIAWKEAEQQRRDAIVAEQQAFIVNGFKAVRAGKKNAYMYIQSMPISVETDEDYENFKLTLKTEPLSAGIFGLHFTKTEDVERVARRLRLHGYPSALIPLQEADWEAAEDYFTITELYKDKYSAEERRRLDEANQQMNDSFVKNIDNWYLNIPDY